MNKFLSRVRFAVNGIIAGLRSQRNLRFQLVILFLTIILGLILPFTYYEWIAVLGVSALVICAELLNTAIELIVDLVSPEWRKEAGMIKDVAAGAVLIASVFAAIIGIIIVLNHIP